MQIDKKLFRLVCKMIVEEFKSEEHKLEQWKMSHTSPCAQVDRHDHVTFGMTLKVYTKKHTGRIFVIYDESKALFDIALIKPNEQEEEVRITGIPLGRIMHVLTMLLE